MEGSINTIGEPLRLQSLGAAGIDILDGKVTIDTSGNIHTAGNIKAEVIEAKSIRTEKLQVTTENSITGNATVGSGVIDTGDLTVTIPTTAITTRSKVFVTATSETGGQPLIVKTKSAGHGFTVKIDQAYMNNVTFDWWIVN